jgi:4-oxalocrotonate tautomerase
MPIITVQFIKDVVATPEQKRQLIAELTNTFVGVVGEVIRPFVYCLIQETPPMEWTIAGVPISDLAALTGTQHGGVVERTDDLMRQAITPDRLEGEPEDQPAGEEHKAEITATTATERKDELTSVAMQMIPFSKRESVLQEAPSPQSHSPPGVAERNKEVVAVLNAALNNQQFDRVAALVAPDVINHTGESSVTVGLEALIESLACFRSAVPEWSVRLDTVVAQHDRVATRCTFAGTHSGAFMGASASGKKVSWTAFIVYRLNDEGKIAERWETVDSVGMLTQFGVVPVTA